MSNLSTKYENLIFKGGGVRGRAYVGALEVLFDKGVIGNIQRVAGSSAGAITALVIALNKNKTETLGIARGLDFAKVKGEPSLLRKNKGKNKDRSGLIKKSAALRALINELGFYNTDYIYNWLKEQIAKVTGGNGTATFKEFYSANRNHKTKDLYVLVTDLSNQSAYICCEKNTPNLEVAKAVLMSMNIPVFFESMAFEEIGSTGKQQTTFFGDGGMMNNYPLNIFDKEPHLPNSKSLGLFLYRRTTLGKYPTFATEVDNDDDNDDIKLKEKVQRLAEYLGGTIQSLLEAQDWRVAGDPRALERTIQIYDCGIKATEFSLSTKDIANLEKEGKIGANNFFNALGGNDIADLQKPLFNTKPHAVSLA